MPPKRPLDAPTEQSGREKKRKKMSHARTIETGQMATSNVPSALQPLPTSIDVVKFAESRAFEIQAMQKAMKSVRNAAASRVWQTLPRHLRRRAASHNVRRVPARLRDRARKEMDPVKKKRLNRFIAKVGKYKKQTRTETLQKRQRNKRWLETHIWHAKRMKMMDLWGYRLALHPTQKSFRPSHRAAMHGCIIHDSSYTATIELKGELPILRLVFARIANPQASSPAAARFINGARVCETEFFEDAAYPFGFIAPVQVLWEAQNASLTSKKADSTQQNGESDAFKPPSATVRTAWLRCHPAAYEKVSQTLGKAVMNILQLEHEAGRLSASVEICDLRGQLNSFELIGPKSSQVIVGALRPVKSATLQTKKHFWKSLKELRTPASCPRGMVVGLQVHDPRLHFPPRDAKIEEKEFDSSTPAFLVQPSAALSESGIWSEKERLGLSRPRYRKRELDARRGLQFIPGTELAPLQDDDRIPLVLVQKSLTAPLSTNQNRSSSAAQIMHGWTVILPLGWGMAFWSSFIFTGTRVGGLRESKSQAIESGLPFFPDTFSGTQLGQAAHAARGQVLKEKWDRTPPAKRVSYEALGNRSPFEPDWDLVCGIIRAAPSEPGVVATQRVTDEIPETWLLYGQDTKRILMDVIQASDPAVMLLTSINAARVSHNLSELSLAAASVFKSALVLVCLTMCGRGTPTDMSAIFDPTPAECKAWESKGNLSGEDAIKMFQERIPPPPIIGYVTSGRPSLARGRGLGVGAMALSKLVESVRARGSTSILMPHLVKIRESHGEVYYPAMLEVV